MIVAQQGKLSDAARALGVDASGGGCGTVDDLLGTR